ncbi:ArsR/SmtB family transcription factor [Brachybacterium sacelli]|uniref:DNA-binding transcriptional ArsR family regulator n=1 Tax=Brachybacterium sacelli TaxID=173364 RepID=A0ABS4X6E0_9MICO|nr:helix-turn-helix domain-containing protein [Brachybacterium sacelli]MBP2384020.1 DNA-binding transcriptional ArsR family regulator [Brachybacterium sacelli]
MPTTRRVVDDVETLKALSHPIRLRLLGTLRSDGPATATELARVLGESSGSTSYHLRQLERYGFVADAEEQPSRRERRWRATHDMTEFAEDLSSRPGAWAALGQVRDRQLQALVDGVDAWRVSGADEGHRHDDYLLRLDPEDVQEMTAEIASVVERYRDRTGSQPIALHVLALPRTP